MAITISTKRLQISKTQTTIMITVSIAVFFTIFSTFASKALISKRSYQSRVIAAQQKAEKALTKDITNANALIANYQTFESQNPNIIGGDSTNRNGDRNGDNATIVLDALPSEYDFPALASSLEKVFIKGNFGVSSITGTDDALNQQQTASAQPQPVPIPFSLDLSGSYSSMPNIIALFENSIRPFQIQSASLSGGSGKMTLSVKVLTYYQPAKTLNITDKVVK